jgi:hypothetical protein
MNISTKLLSILVILFFPICLGILFATAYVEKEEIIKLKQEVNTLKIFAKNSSIGIRNHCIKFDRIK